MTAEYPLPVQQKIGGKNTAEGFCTPSQDRQRQCARFLPKRVMPVIFLPGIMGSNLRLSAERQSQLARNNNIAWRPDSVGLMSAKSNAGSSSRERQMRLDPEQTTVDLYDPSAGLEVAGDKRNDNVKLSRHFRSPVLSDDPPAMQGQKTAEQKARERGWGEVFFKSYGEMLQHMESRLNAMFVDGKMQPDWNDVVGVDPKAWKADPSCALRAISEAELKQVSSHCWFAVYAFGYNWLQSNGTSAKAIANRVRKTMRELNNAGYQCEKVIIVTHSMGGLVGRALVHESYGNLSREILGIVHGVMPAIGAPAAYKRIKAGFEDPGLNSFSPLESIGAKIAGNFGDEVTAVLANAPGPLELLPSRIYGNGWLRVTHKGNDLARLPEHGDPYEEIYKLRGKWYGLLREEWLNPSGLSPKQGGGNYSKTCDYLDRAKSFHDAISSSYHPNSFAHYGSDPNQRSFGEVVWSISNSCADPAGWQDWKPIGDTRQGTLEFFRFSFKDHEHEKAFGSVRGVNAPQPITAVIIPPTSPGDKTVPAASADHQRNSGKFKGIFRQTGYEHQSSYSDPSAVASTLYSIVRIAQCAGSE